MMQIKLYKKITALFPRSPVDANPSLPGKLESGKILTYTARLSAQEVEAIVLHFTGENPNAPKVDTTTLKNWKHQIQYDEEGCKRYEESEDGSPSKTLLRAWEPIQFTDNRKAGLPHVKLLTNRFGRTGYKSSLRKLVIGSNGNLLDGQHTLLALWYYFQEDQEGHVDVSLEINSLDDPTELFRYFDQAQRRRTLKDALTTLPGLPEGFEAEIAGTLRFVTLLSSGRGLNQSRLNLPHLVNEKGKPLSLQPDDIASLLSAGECFEYCQETLVPLFSQEIVFWNEREESEENILIFNHPGLTGPGLPNAQYWMTAYLNAQYDTRMGSKLTHEDFVKFLQACTSDAPESKAVSKLMTYRPAKAVDWLPAIEHCFSCFQEGTEPKRSMPKAPTFNGIQAKYDDYYDSLNSILED